MSEEEELFQQLLSIVQKYYPYEDHSYQEVQERKDIVRQNWKSVQKWQEFAGNYVEYDKRADFLDQINTALKIFPLVTQYLTIKSKGHSLKKVQTVQVQQYYQLKPILSTFEIKSKQRIISHLNNSSNIQEYISKQVSFIVDILQRRSKLSDYFKFLVLQSRNISHFAQKFGTMKFVDFIIILQKFTYPNDIISFLIAQQGAPSPVQFTALDQHVNYANQFVSLLKFKKHHLVLNIWSSNSKKYVGERIYNNKHVLFSTALQIDQIYFTGSHFEEVINLYKLIVRQKEMVFIDYVEKEKQYENQQNNLVIELFRQAQIVIFHLDQKDLQQTQQMERTDNYLFFLQKYYHNKTNDPTQIIRFFCQQISNKILISNINKAIKPYYPLVVNGDILRYQSNISKPSLQSFYKIFQSLGKPQLQHKKIFTVNSLSAQKLKKYTHYEEIMSFLNYQISHSQKIQNLPKVCKQKELNQIRAQKNTLSISEIRQQTQKKLTEQNGGQNHTQTMLQVLQKSNEQYMNRLSKLSQKQEELKKQLLVAELSHFVQSCKRYIQQQDGIQIQEFTDGLIEKTSQITKAQLSILQEAYPGDKKVDKAYKSAKKQIMSNHISIDEIYYQYNVFNELTIDKNKQNPTSFQQFYINQYYQKCLNTQGTFNIVDGETSNFGNKSLQRFFEQIKRKQDEEYKEIFVICAIGPKSSGKSTLFNYLFHYNIHMREDEYAKGIYVGQCQISKKTIIVLDTAGIMQIDFAKDNYSFTSEQLGQIFATFDHQIASLLLKVSDLVVFAGTTEQKKDHLIPQQLQLAVGVCYKVLNAIQVNNYSDQKKFIPKRIMFALNKRSETSPNIDKQLAIQLMIKHLQPILLLQMQDPNGEKDPRKLFQKYMRLQAQDIFQLPSLYQNNQNITKVNEAYGLQILGLRSKILKHLEKIQSHRVNPQQLIGFYRKAQVNWDMIMVTGSNILKAQSLNESYERQLIFALYRQLYPTIYQQMMKNIDQILPESNFQPLTFTPKQVSQLIAKQQQSTFDSWTFFSIKLNDYLTVIYKSSNNKPSTYQNIIEQCVKIFQDQAQKSIPNLQKYSDLYLTSIKKLFDVIFYRRVKRYYRSFQSIFAVGIQQFTFKKILVIIQNLNIEEKYDKQERQQIFDRQTNKILNSEYFKPVKREVISSNLNSLFGTILSTENVFISELQIQSINDCLIFDQQINQKYITNLNQFIYFENYQEIKQNYRAQFARLIENNIKEFNQLIVKAFKDKVTSFDIRDDFQYVKDYIIDAQTDKLALQITQVSKRIYAQIAQLDESKRYYNLQQSLEQEEQQLTNKKTEKVNSLQAIQASLTKISQDLVEATPEDQKKLKKQEEQLLLRKQKQTQDLEEIDRQMVYLLTIRKTTFNLPQQRISLTKINFVILLLAKLFKKLQQIIYFQQLAQLNQFKAAYINDVNQSKQQAITYLDQISTKFTKAIDDDYQACSVRWKRQFEENLTSIYKGKVADTLKGSDKIKLKLKIEGNTINNQSIDNQQSLNREQRKKLYIQCYKYVINPQRYIIEELYIQLTASSQIAYMIDEAYLGIEKQIIQILEFKVSSPDPQNHETERRNFLQEKQLNKMYTFVVSGQKKVVFSTEELINQFKKKLAANAPSLKIAIKDSANQQQIISHIRKQILGIREQFLGCTQGCPFCGAMCINVRMHSGQHNTNHNNLAFRGCRDQNNYIIVKNCTNHMKKEYWSYNYKTYKDHFAFLNKVHKFWLYEFQNPQPAAQQISNYLKVWANIEEAAIEAFKKRHQYKFGLNQSTISSVIQERRRNFFVNANDIKENKLENYWVSVVDF